MATWLKQSTAATVKLGPFLDDTDGKTAETALTIKKADVRLSKNGGDMAAAHADQGASDAGAAHDELGYYDISLDTTDTDTLGRLKIMVHESGALPVWQDFQVLPANTFDSLVAGTDYLNADAKQIEGGDATDALTAAVPTAAAIADAVWDEDLGGSHEIGDSTADTLRNAAAAVDTINTAVSNMSGTTDAIVADTNELQADWANGGRLDLLIDAIKIQTDKLPADPVDESDIDGPLEGLDTAIADIHTDVAAVKTVVDAILVDTGTTLEADLDAILADTDELQGDLANGGRLDLLIDAVKAKTDLITGTGAGAVTFTYTLTSSIDSAPIPDAAVWVTTDAAGEEIVASGSTDAAGQVTFYLDAGTYYLWRQKAGWNFSNPDTETVA